MDKDGYNPKPKETKNASTGIALFCTVALTFCFTVATIYKVDVPIWLYAIFGGGILGTDNIIKVIKSIFRIS